MQRVEQVSPQEGLGKNGVRPGVFGRPKRLFPVDVFSATRYGDDLGVRVIFADFFDALDPAHARHEDIDDDCVEGRVEGKNGLNIFGNNGLIAVIV